MVTVVHGSVKRNSLLRAAVRIQVYVEMFNHQLSSLYTSQIRALS